MRSAELSMLLGSVLARRIFLGVSIGILAFIAIQLVRILAAASGLCTDCSSADGPDALAAASFGGGGGALGGGDPGGLPDDDGPPRSRFDRWWDRNFGPSRPPKSVESVDTPETPAPPTQEEIDEAKKGWDLYEWFTGSQGPIKPEAGSTAEGVHDAFGRTFDFASGQTEVGPSGEGDKP